MKMRVVKRTDNSVLINTSTGIIEVMKGHSMEEWQPIADALDKLEAIRARVKGEWDNPELVKYGALSVSPFDDIKRILNS